MVVSPSRSDYYLDADMYDRSSRRSVYDHDPNESASEFYRSSYALNSSRSVSITITCLLSTSLYLPSFLPSFLSSFLPPPPLRRSFSLWSRRSRDDTGIYFFKKHFSVCSVSVSVSEQSGRNRNGRSFVPSAFMFRLFNDN